MKKRRLLITGGSGLLAINWACAVRDKWEVVLGTHRHLVTLAGTVSCELHLDDAGTFGLQLDRLAPDLVVHAAGLTNVDTCEENRQLAHVANAEIARTVAKVTAEAGIPLIHISTDHLFSGDHGPYKESDSPQPINQYARSKLLAEEWVLQAHPQALAIRTNFFGWGSTLRQSFSDWIIYNVRAGRTLALFDDVCFTPILIDALARAAHELVTLGARGVFNVAGDERMTKYDFAMRLVGHFSLPASLIRPDQMVNAQLRAPRPRDMSLDNSKASALIGRGFGGLDEHLSLLRAQEDQGRSAELRDAVSRLRLTSC